MGIAIAEAARDAGWDVTLLLGPVSAQAPTGVRVERFTSTDDLARLLDTHFPTCDVLIMAAAVADYRPAKTASNKMPRNSQTLLVELTPTSDLVQTCARRRQPQQRIVGFALEEPASLDSRAMQKLRTKQLDAIVANPLGTMDSECIAAKIFTPDGRTHWPAQAGTINKQSFAKWLVGWIETELVLDR